MPIEIREVVVKAQLEKTRSTPQQSTAVSEDQIRELKEEILSELLEKMEEKLWKTLER
ncbi:MAG: DUF5908 family protein [Bacteroidota bacterium]